jgi:hypothetical protein
MQQSNPIQVALNWVSVAPLSSDQSQTKLVAMTMMVAVPAVMMMMVIVLRAR